MVILNEKKYAEHCLLTGEVDAKPRKTLKVLAKYYYYCLGHRKTRIIANLADFMRSNYERYQYSRKEWMQTIEGIAKRASKEPLYENDGVWITSSELAKIDELEDPTLQRVIFTMLCFAKLNMIRNPKKNGWIKVPNGEILESAGVSATKVKMGAILGTLRDLGYLDFPKRNGNMSNRLMFIDVDGENALFISDFRALGNEFMLYKGERYIRCKSCGLLVKGSKNGRKQYCRVCNPRTPEMMKTCYCVECGKQISVKSKANRWGENLWCPECMEIRRKTKKIETQRKRRNKENEVITNCN